MLRTWVRRAAIAVVPVVAAAGLLFSAGASPALAAGPYYIIDGGNFYITGNGHGTLVQTASPGQGTPQYTWVLEGNANGYPYYKVRDTFNNLCLDAAVNPNSGTFEIYEESCGGANYEYFQHIGNWITNIGVSDYFGCGGTCGKMQANGIGNGYFVSVVASPGADNRNQWTLL